MQNDSSAAEQDNVLSASYYPKEEKIRNLWPEAVILVIFVFFLYSIHIIGGLTPLTASYSCTDIDFEWLRFATFQKNAPPHHFPLWMTGECSGLPSIGFVHVGMIYPLTWIYRILPFLDGYFIRLIILQTVMGFGTLLLLNFFGLSRLARLIGAMSLTAGGLINFAMYVDPTLNTIAWLPFFFYFSLRVCRYGRLRDGLAIPPIVFLQITGGDMESFVYECIGMGIFLLLLGPQVTGRSRLENFIRLSFWGMLGIIMAMIQFLPGQEFISRSVRTLEGTEELLKTSFNMRSPRYLLYVLPLHRFIGNIGYLGFVALFFGIYAIVKMHSRFIIILTIFAIIIILHPLLIYWVPPYFEFFVHLPILKKLWGPQRMVYIAEFFLIIIPGFGIDYAFRKENIYSIMRLFFATGVFFGLVTGLTSGVWTLLPWSALCLFLLLIAGKRILNLKRAGILLVLTLVLDLGVTFIVRLPKTSRDIFDYDTVYTAFFQSRIPLGRSVTALSTYFDDKLYLPRQNGILFGTEAIDGWLSVPILRYVKLLTIFRPDALNIQNGQILSNEWFFKLKEPGLIDSKTFHLLDLLNVYYFSVKGVNLKFASPYSLLKELPDNIKKGVSPRKTPRLIYVDRDGVDTMTLELERDWSFEWNVYVSPGDTFSYDLGSNGPSGTIRIEISTPSSAPQLINESLWGPVTGGNWVYSPSQTVNLNRWGGQSVILRVSIQIENNSSGAFQVQGLEIFNPDKSLQRIRNGKTEIYLNREAMGRSYIVHKARVFSDDEQILSYMADRDKFKIKDEILLGANQLKDIQSNNEPNLPPSSSEQAQIVNYGQDRVVEKASLRTPGFVALTDTYYPGWRCFVDGKEAKILQSNYTFRAVKLLAGSRVLDWIYEPESFRIGLWVSISSAVLWVIVSLLYIKRKR